MDMCLIGTRQPELIINLVIFLWQTQYKGLKKPTCVCLFEGFLFSSIFEDKMLAVNVTFTVCGDKLFYFGWRFQAFGVFCDSIQCK